MSCLQQAPRRRTIRSSWSSLGLSDGISALPVIAFTIVGLLAVGVPQSQAQTRTGMGTLRGSGAGPSSYGSGRALALDGIDDHVRLPEDPAINTGGPYDGRTIDLWFHGVDLGRSTEQVLYEEGGEAEGLNIYVEGGSLYVGMWRDQAFSQWLATDAVTSGRWHHVALVFDGSDGVIRGYLDGKLFGTGPSSTTLADHQGGTAIGGVVSEAQFKGGLLDKEGRYFEGKMDQVRLWNAALTKREIRVRARRTIDPAAPVADSLIAAYRFDATSDSTVRDYATSDGTAQDGSLSGDPTRVRGSGAPIGDVSAVRTSADTTLGPPGATITVKNVSTSGSDAIQVYQYGSTDGAALYAPDPGEDFSGASDDVVKRLNVVWGIDTLGTSPDAYVTFDYTELSGLRDPTELRFLRRAAPGHPWAEVTSEFTWDKNNRELRVHRLPATGEYAIGEYLPPPSAHDDRDTTDQDADLRVGAPGVLANDTDPEGDALFAEQTSGVGAGHLTVDRDGAFRYSPGSAFDSLGVGESETVAFAYEASDSLGTDDEAQVRITVQGRNDAPTARAERERTTEATPLQVAAPGVLDNDDDVDGDALEAHVDRAPSVGRLTLAEDGSFEYDPNGAFRALRAGQRDSTQFTYVARDTHGATDRATVTVTVTGTNTRPVAAGDRDTTDQGGTARTVVLANDTDPEGRLDTSSVSIVEFPSHGSIRRSNAGTVTYVPDSSFAGVDRYRYAVADVEGRSDTASVAVVVANTAPMGVTAVHATGAHRSATIDWAPSAAPDFSAYHVYQSTTPGVDGSTPLDTIPDRSVTTYRADGLSNRDVYHFGVTVRDTAGNESPPASVRAVPRPPTVSWTGSRSFGAVEKTTGYRMVGVPGAPQGTRLDSTLSGTPGKDWTAYAAPGITSAEGLVSFRAAPDSLRLRQGRGVWVLSEKDWSPRGSVSAVSLSSGLSAAVPVPEGWSIITNPFPDPVQWHRVQRATPGLDSARTLWGFDGSYSDRDHLEPYEGYFLFNDPSDPIDTLRVPYPMGSAQSGARKNVVARTDESSRESGVTLVANGGDAEARIQLQVGAKAARTRDGADRFAPPAIGEGLWMALRSEAASSAYPWLRSEGRPLGSDGVATFHLRIRGPVGRTVRVSAEDVDRLGEMGLFLADPGTERIFDLRREAATVHLAGGTEGETRRDLEVWVGSPDALDERRDARAPGQLALRPPTPNPTQSSARLQYTIPERRGPVRAELVIYDVLGREVQRLVDEKRAPGRYVVHWQGRDRGGQVLSSGMYLCRFLADGRVVDTRKLTLVR